jgi:tRNA dimethylallyltransferase
MNKPFTTVAVCGPTASGKSDVGIALARAVDGEVVNVDSVQVYKDFCIGAAKVPVEERQGVPHHLLDIFSPEAPANVSEFREASLRALDDITARGKLPILVGGSGMYFTILLHGLAEVPATPAEVRNEIAQLSPEVAHAELARLDPETAARLHINDRQRVTRALEILRVSGRKPSELFAEHQFKAKDVVSLVVVICRPRDELYRRIDVRSRLMLEQGLIEETQAIRDKYGEIALLDTLGYKQAKQFIANELSYEETVTEIALHTRRFAKRQMTFWRNEPGKRGWDVRPYEGEQSVEIAGFESAPKRAHKNMVGFRALSLSEAELIKSVRERLTRPLERTEVWYVSVGS